MRAATLAGLLLALSGPAAACGYCVEDKIAAVYDHAVITKAIARKQHVAFFHVDGPVSPVQTRLALEQAVHAVGAVEKGSVRLSPDALTLSFAFDPGRASLAAINAQIDRRLAARKLSLLPMRVMEQPADFKLVARPRR